MTANLPPIVTNSEAISGDLGSIDHVVVEDIYFLWRVYTTNKSVLPNDIGHRLENFFWRIWGNDQICRNISGATLARIFQDISEAKEIKNVPAAALAIQSVPPSSDAARPQSRHKDHSPTRLDQQSRNAFSQSSLVTEAETSHPRPPPSPSRVQPTPLTSILRKTRRVEPTRSEGDDYDVPLDEAVVARPGPAKQQPPTPTSPIRKSSADSAALRRKKATFVATTASSSRRRPTITRRKSTQTYTSNAQLVKSPTALPTEPENGLEVPALMLGKTAKTDIKGKGRATAAEGENEDAVSKPQVRADPESVPISNEDLAVQRNTLINSGTLHPGESSKSVLKTRTSGQDLSNLLVDRDFRSKFFDKSRKGELFSLTNLSMTPTTTSSTNKLYSKSSEASSSSRSFRKGKATQVVIVDGVAPLRPEGATAPSSRSSSPSDSQLPRTKSQLTLLLERERRNGVVGGNTNNRTSTSSPSKPDYKPKSRMI
ncbi:MAG: hypothetical protein M1829_003402 [Trizodia sp. TS-e1964]|nr:MAG: hypothetical protein M1829_003402 [Trizodia sp. TS-e1964]